jgi:hypothetical protein
MLKKHHHDKPKDETCSSMPGIAAGMFSGIISPLVTKSIAPAAKAKP